MALSAAHWLSAPLPADVHSVKGVQALEEQLFDQPQVSPTLLMKRAGRCAMDALTHYWPEPEKITIYCGSGNNGGDGYIVAALAKARCIPVTVIQLGDPKTESAKRAYEYALAESVEVQTFEQHDQPKSGIVVDAIFGIGLNRPVTGSANTAITEMNQSGLPVLSLDTPSGLCGNTGQILGVAVKAQATTTFVALKAGLLTPQGRFHSGKLLCATPEVLLTEMAESGIHLDNTIAPIATRINDQVLPNFEARSENAHKGHFGHVVVVGGDAGMGGAAILSAQSAARSGAGLVSLATKAEHVTASLMRAPEIMAKDTSSGQELEPLLEKPTHIVLGPGLGNSAWSSQMLQRVLMANKPTVFDADALNMLASQDRLSLSSHSAQKVLTPHPGEAARLLGISTAEVENNRWQAAAQLRERFTATVVLKGACTVVATLDKATSDDSSKENTQHLWVCDKGNPGMASGGMGDVLAGMIASLMAQGMNSDQAALWGVLLHAQAGDELAEQYGQRGLQASDLLPQVRKILHQYEQAHSL